METIQQNDVKHKNQKLPKILDWVLRFFIMLMIPFLLAIGSARLVMTPAFLNFEYQRPNFSMDNYGMTVEDRMIYGPYGVRYIVNNEPVEYLADLELPATLCYPESERACNAFNSLEVSHMEDVQTVAQGLFLAGIIGTIATLISSFALVWGNGFHSLRLALLQGSTLTIGLIIAVVLLAVTAWDTFFGGFHSIFFDDGTWQFYYSDTLIRLYPEQFWFDASLLVGGLTVIGAFIILGIALRFRLVRS